MNINSIDELSTYPSNCLALTVKNNYKLTIGKNIVRKGTKFTLRIALWILSLNILNMLLK